MAKICVVGLGPGALGQMSLETFELLTSGQKVYLRTEQHPCVQELRARGVKYESFDKFYNQASSFESVYAQIVEQLIKAAQRENVIYAVPGHPRTAERTVELLIAAAGDSGTVVEVRSAMSFMDPLFNSLGVDPVNGVSIIDGSASIKSPNYRVWNIVCQVYDRFTASERKLDLMNYYPDEFSIFVVRAAGLEDERVEKVPLFELDHLNWLDHLTCLAIPPLTADLYPADWDKLLDVMELLRDPQGCPWDREQTHSSLKPYLIEETYEVIEALDENNMHKLCEELGDLLLQIVFHAQIAKENNEFSIADVIQGIVEKLIRRHPHVFANVSVENSTQVLANWDAIKETEHGKKESIFEGIAKTLTALMYAKKVQAKAAKVGFDWDTIDGPAEKVREELIELLTAATSAQQEEELGDLLFAVVNLSRFIDVDPEIALRQAVEKFKGRFNVIEEIAKQQNKQLKELTTQEMDIIWEKTKEQ